MREIHCSICFVLSDTTNSEISCCYISIWMVFFSSLPLLIINHITILQVKTQHSIFLDAKAPVLSVSQSVGWSHFLKSRVWRSNSRFIMIQIYPTMMKFIWLHTIMKFKLKPVKSHPRVSQESVKSHPRVIQESSKSHLKSRPRSANSQPIVSQESVKPVKDILDSKVSSVS